MEARGCGYPTWADAEEVYRTGQDGWGTGVGKCLSCLPGQQKPHPGISMPWSIGEGSIRESPRGFMGSHLCTGPDLAGGFGAVPILEVSLPRCLFVGQFGKFEMCESFAPAISVLGLSPGDLLRSVHADLCAAVFTVVHTM